MSLHIGNLSPHTRGDDLKRVFWRFGRCSLRLKDGYGFVVYDLVQDAEKALRALQGRNICGEDLTLTWSNKQPKPFQSHPRDLRSYELQRGGNFSGRGDYGSRNVISNDWRDYELDYEQPDSDGRRLNSVNMLDEDRGDQQGTINDYNGEHHDFREGRPVDSGIVVPKSVDSGRWGEHVHDPSHADEIDGVEFGRYEPYQGHDMEDEDENHHMAHYGGGPGGSAPQSSKENVRRNETIYTTLNHSNGFKQRNTCFSCGGTGHKIRNCPRKYSSARNFTRFDHRQDECINKRSRGEPEQERYVSRSSEKLQSSKETASMHMNDMTESGSGNHQRLIDNGSSPTRKESGKTQIKDCVGKKRSGREGESPEGHSGKKARRSVSSSPGSENHASRSKSPRTSQPSKSMSRSCSRSRSRSVSRRAHSLSPNSRTSSKSKCSKSRSRSNSSTSWSVSLSHSSSPPNKGFANLKASAYKSNTPKSMEVEHRQAIEGDVGIENADDENTMATVKNNHAVSGFEVVDDMKYDQPLQRNDENHPTSRSIFDVTNPSTPLREIGAHTAESSSPEGLKDTLDLQNSGAPVTGHMSPQSKEPASETLVNYRTGHLACIPSDEMCRVLKHHGLELPEGSEQHAPIEGYFGSARLWPWEIIYYRKLKKGLISVENYARRVAQNQEFGIVDKYIRSSSGWGEMSQDNQ